MTTLHVRKSIGRSPLRRGFLLIPLVLACFALSPRAQAVVPAPDGGYPGSNTAEGTQSLENLPLPAAGGGVWNTALGFQALFSNTTGSTNTATGLRSLMSNTSGSNNTAIGQGALVSNTVGQKNTAVGTFALASNIGVVGSLFGNFNTAVGDHALADNRSGGEQTAVGNHALDSIIGGLRNTALGYAAGANLTSGIGGNLYLGANMSGVANESNHTYIRNVDNTTVSGATVTVDLATGLIGHLSSSRRYKDDIKPMDKASEALYRLHPVTFRYKKGIDRTQSCAFGLIAEEVAEVNQDLVARNSQGQSEAVHYEMVNAMLLNEFLKEHRKVEELEKGMKVLTAQLKDQAAQIQKVSAQLEVSRPAPQTVLNNQ